MDAMDRTEQTRPSPCFNMEFLVISHPETRLASFGVLDVVRDGVRMHRAAISLTQICTRRPYYHR